MNTVQRAVMRQLQQSPHLRQQIGRQVAEVMTTGRASTRITVKLPIPPDNTKPDFVSNRNRGKMRFVLTGTQRKERRE